MFAADPPEKTFARRAEVEFHRAQTAWLADTNNATAGWQFARAAYDWADFATNGTQRADIARHGIAACRQLLERKLKLAAPHYYLAMNLGQLARTETIGALSIVKEMEYEFKLANALDEKFDYAGPARNLGLLYEQAPGWPVSLGSRANAADWLNHALKIAPEYPENTLNLAEAHLLWKQRAEADEQLKALDVLWPVARKNFTGETWEESWADWSKRRDAVRRELDAPPTAAISPRDGH